MDVLKAAKPQLKPNTTIEKNQKTSGEEEGFKESETTQVHIIGTTRKYSSEKKEFDWLNGAIVSSAKEKAGWLNAKNELAKLGYKNINTIALCQAGNG